MCFCTALETEKIIIQGPRLHLMMMEVLRCHCTSALILSVAFARPQLCCARAASLRTREPLFQAQTTSKKVKKHQLAYEKANRSPCFHGCARKKPFARDRRQAHTLSCPCVVHLALSQTKSQSTGSARRHLRWHCMYDEHRPDCSLSSQCKPRTGTQSQR